MLETLRKKFVQNAKQKVGVAPSKIFLFVVRVCFSVVVSVVVVLLCFGWPSFRNWHYMVGFCSTFEPPKRDIVHAFA